MMDVVVIFNGLGNQMSQYSFFLKKRNNDRSTYLMPFCNDHNGLELNKVFNINIKKTIFNSFLYLLFRLLLTERVKWATKPLRLFFILFDIKIIKENFNYNFNEDYLRPSKGITFYYGGWPSERYFMSEKSDILKAFEFVNPLSEENSDHIGTITANNSVSIHVRRGDYLNADNLKLFGEVCNINYYKKAIQFIESQVDKPHFYVFSNDMSWVFNNIPLSRVTYVTCNKETQAWKDMYLMSICKHNIVANSTFSWWGAWLNKNPEKIVVCPSRYLNSDIDTDFYPESWIKLSDY